jgi:hypothetical protein
MSKCSIHSYRTLSLGADEFQDQLCTDFGTNLVRPRERSEGKRGIDETLSAELE